MLQEVHNHGDVPKPHQPPLAKVKQAGDPVFDLLKVMATVRRAALEDLNLLHPLFQAGHTGVVGRMFESGTVRHKAAANYSHLKSYRDWMSLLPHLASMFTIQGLPVLAFCLHNASFPRHCHLPYSSGVLCR